MPAFAGQLLGRRSKSFFVELAVLFRRDHRDLIIIQLALVVHSDAALAVGERMPMQA